MRSENRAASSSMGSAFSGANPRKGARSLTAIGCRRRRRGLAREGDDLHQDAGSSLVRSRGGCIGSDGRLVVVATGYARAGSLASQLCTWPRHFSIHIHRFKVSNFVRSTMRKLRKTTYPLRFASAFFCAVLPKSDRIRKRDNRLLRVHRLLRPCDRRRRTSRWNACAFNPRCRGRCRRLFVRRSQQQLTNILLWDVDACRLFSRLGVRVDEQRAAREVGLRVVELVESRGRIGGADGRDGGAGGGSTEVGSLWKGRGGGRRGQAAVSALLGVDAVGSRS